VEPIVLVVVEFDVTVADGRDGESAQPRDAVALGTQQLLPAAHVAPTAFCQQGAAEKKTVSPEDFLARFPERLTIFK